MEREISKITRKAVKKVVNNETDKVEVNENNVSDYLGVKKFKYGEKDEEDRVGVVTGLAWTEFGGEILKIEKHPNADRLKVCDVDVGEKEIKKVVCGAPNAREGLITIYAPPGAIIPKTNFELKVAKIRGVESKGMLCSESELNLSEESEGIIELKNKEKEIGKSYFKSSSQKSIDISITPNRADCLGVRGIARDLSSAGVGKLIPINRKKIKQSAKHQIKISITKENNISSIQ